MASVEENNSNSGEDETEINDRPLTRSQGRPGLRDIRQPAGSHLNRFEKEFQRDTRESFQERQTHVMVEGKRHDRYKSRSAHQGVKLRSGACNQKWMNNKKGEGRASKNEG